jgi:Ca2+-binding RTX toxin-like protein
LTSPGQIRRQRRNKPLVRNEQRFANLTNHKCIKLYAGGSNGTIVVGNRPATGTNHDSSVNSSSSKQGDSAENYGASGENIYLNGDIETLIAGSGNDLLSAYNYPAELVAGSRNDTLISGHGYATLIGGSGNDLFRTQNNLPDTIIGGGGVNTAITDPFDTVSKVQHRTT